MIPTDGSDDLQTVTEVAAKLHVRPSWIYAQVVSEDGDLPHVRVGRYVRFEPAAIAEYIARHRHGAQPDIDARPSLLLRQAS